MGGDTGDHSEPITGKLLALTSIATMAGKQINAYGFSLRELTQQVLHCFHKNMSQKTIPMIPVLIKTEIIMLCAVLVANKIYFEAIAPFSPTIKPWPSHGLSFQPLI